MKVDVIEVWQDEDTKEVFEAKSSFLLKDVKRIMDYTERAYSLGWHYGEQVFIIMNNDDRLIILYNYNDFNNLWTEFLDKNTHYTLN